MHVLASPLISPIMRSIPLGAWVPPPSNLDLKPPERTTEVTPSSMNGLQYELVPTTVSITRFKFHKLSKDKEAKKVFILDYSSKFKEKTSNDSNSVSFFRELQLMCIEKLL